MKYPIEVSVPVLGRTLNLQANRGTKVSKIFKQVCEILEIKEKYWFGIKYLKRRNIIAWLKLSRRVGSLRTAPAETVRLELSARFYPSDVQNQIDDPVSLRFFYLLSLSQLVKDRFTIDDWCPSSTLIELAAYSLRVKSHPPDQDEQDKLGPGFVSGLISYRIIERIIAMENSSATEVESQVRNKYEQIKDVAVEDAMLGFLKRAEDLDSYGILDVIPVENRVDSKQRGFMSVGPTGISFFRKSYSGSYQLETHMRFEEVRKIGFLGKKLNIVMKDGVKPKWHLFKTEQRFSRIVVENVRAYNQFHLYLHKINKPVN